MNDRTSANRGRRSRAPGCGGSTACVWASGVLKGTWIVAGAPSGGGRVAGARAIQNFQVLRAQREIRLATVLARQEAAREREIRDDREALGAAQRREPGFEVRAIVEVVM